MPDTTLKVEPPPAGAIGAEVSDFDLAQVSEVQARELKGLVYEHKLVVFRGQHLAPAAYVAMAQRFGRVQIYFQPNYHHPEHPEIFVSANVPLNGQKVGVAGTGRYWHTDYQFFEEPLPLTFVYPQQFPAVRRETYYIDMERVWRELPGELRATLQGRRCVHDAKLRYKVQPCDVDRSLLELMEAFTREAPPVTHPAVIRHPVTGREALYASEGFTVAIEDLAHEPSQAALERVFAFTRRDEHVHTHTWREGDVLLWDNRVLLHKASSVPKGEPSVSFRVGVYDGLPFYVPRGGRVSAAEASAAR